MCLINLTTIHIHFSLIWITIYSKYVFSFFVLDSFKYIEIIDFQNCIGLSPSACFKYIFL